MRSRKSPWPIERVVFAWLGLLAIVSPLAADPFRQAHEAVVGIYSQRGNGSVSQGTGFFVSGDGRIVTAYHVIQGAKEIEIYDSDRRVMKPVAVESIYPDIDLAVLRAPQPPGSGFIPMPQRLPSLQRRRPVVAIGHPHGIPFQEFRGELTNDGLVDSEKLWHEKKQIFAKSIEVIPLDITADRGISGGPVLDENGVLIGVLSGSYGPGRTYAWAIPITSIGKARNELTRRSWPQNIKWPPILLLRRTWNSLEDTYSLDVGAANSLGVFRVSVDDLDRAYDDITVEAGQSLPVVEAAGDRLTDGISTSRSLKPGSLKPFIEVMYDLHSRLGSFRDIVRNYQKASTRIEDARQQLKPHVKRRSLDLTDPGLQELMRSTLRSVAASGSVDDARLKKALGEIASGLQLMAEGIRECQAVEQQGGRGFDRDARDALRLLRDAVGKIQDGLQMALGAKFQGDASRNIHQLRDVLKLSELILYYQ